MTQAREDGNGPVAEEGRNGQAGTHTNGKPTYRTVAELAEAKQLPVQFLLGQGLYDIDGGGIGISYFTEDGADLYVKTRGVPGRPRFECPAGVKQQPYGLWRLADWSGSTTLHLAEGESDALTCWHHDLPALGLPGSNGTGALLAEHLCGIRTVYVMPDNDQGGKTFAEGVAKRLAQIGFDGRAFVVHLPDNVKDVNELHCRVGSGFRDALDRLVKYSSELPMKDGKRTRQEAKEARTSPDAGAVTVRLKDCDKLRIRPTEWLVPDFFPRGGLTVIAGDGGDGKSAITLGLTATLSQGLPCLGLSYAAPDPCRVVIIGCEDDEEATVIPRLAAAGADLAKVKLMDCALTAGGAEESFTLAHIAALDAAIEQLGDVGLVIIDPVSAFIPGKVDDHRDAEVRGLLRPLSALAARRNLAIILIKHLNKSDSGNSGNLVAGSRAYVNAARAAFLVGADPTDEHKSGRCVLVYSKRNLTSRGQGLAYSKVLLTKGEQDDVLELRQAQDLTAEQQERLRQQLFKIRWDGPTDVTDKDLARARRGGAEKDATRDTEASEWLKAKLAAGPLPSKQVFKDAATAGFNKHHVYAAKSLLGVRASNRGAFKGEWRWGLTDPSTWPQQEVEGPPRKRIRRDGEDAA